MRKALRSGMRACLASILASVVASMAWHPGSAAEMPRPEDGAVADGVYANKYFDLSYPLPAGWTQDVAGPAPSVGGYYVLASLLPAGELTGTILISAQDQFFVDATAEDPATASREFAAAMSKIPDMRIDQPPLQLTLGGRSFHRVDFSGVGLHRSTFFTQSRCHLVMFNLTASSRERLAALVPTLERIGAARGGAAEPPDPPCRRGHATPENLLSKVDPAPSGPAFTPIPVRIVVGRDGGVRNVHVIRATREQRSGIEAALGQWKFKPPALDGRSTEIETGLLIEFRAGGAVAYLAGLR
jgi:hypothetical protein